VHRSAWPAAPDFGDPPSAADDAVLAAATAAVAAIRRARSGAQLPVKTEIPLLILSGARPDLDALAAASQDVRSAGRVAGIELRETGSPGPSHEVVLPPPA
jgi:valyl-tRNA synthetase